VKLLPIKPLSPEWFDYRSSRVSGSTAAAILGVSNPRWSSPLTEWARLTGKRLPPRTVEPWHIWGQETEPSNRAIYQRKTGRFIDVIEGIAQHERLDWLCYTPDGLIVASRGGDAIELPSLFEAKAPSPWKADDWDEAIPLEYQVQAQIGMEVCGLKSASFSALIWPGVKHYDVERDERFTSAAIERIQRFLDYNVKCDIPPEARAGDADRATLKELAHEIAWGMTPEVTLHIEAEKKIAAEIKVLEVDLETHRNRLVQLTGSAGWKDAKAAINRAAKVTA
jgi:putative phage-type endonuclease